MAGVAGNVIRVRSRQLVVGGQGVALAFQVPAGDHHAVRDRFVAGRLRGVGSAESTADFDIEPGESYRVLAALEVWVIPGRRRWRIAKRLVVLVYPGAVADGGIVVDGVV